MGGEHEVGLPALDGLQRDVAGKVGPLALGVSGCLVEDGNGVVVLETTEFFVVALGWVVIYIHGRRRVAD